MNSFKDLAFIVIGSGIGLYLLWGSFKMIFIDLYLTFQFITGLFG